VVLDVHRQVTLAAAERNPLRNRPARERAVAFEAKVVVQAARRVTLDHERCPLAAVARRVVEGLGSLSPAALFTIILERHLWIVASGVTIPSPERCTLEIFPAEPAFQNGG
jgi:hypothetical protein